MTGKVKWFSGSKGYGFLTMEEGTDIFVHYSGINKNGFKSLEEGQNVEFDVVDVERGKQAVNVTVIEENAETKQEEKENK